MPSYDFSSSIEGLIDLYDSIKNVIQGKEDNYGKYYLAYNYVAEHITISRSNGLIRPRREVRVEC